MNTPSSRTHLNAWMLRVLAVPVLYVLTWPPIDIRLNGGDMYEYTYLTRVPGPGAHA